MSPESRKRYARPLLIGLALVGVLYFGPRFRREVIELQFMVPTPDCTTRVGVSLYRDELRAYSIELSTAGSLRHTLKQEVTLQVGPYEARPFAVCDDGVRLEAARLPLILEREGLVRIPVDTRCPCASRR